jgi:hypothetical protein
MTSVEFVWSRSGSDEAFLADIKTALKSIETPLETVEIVYDPPAYDPTSRAFLGDGAAPWLTFLAENVILEHASTLKKIAVDMPCIERPVGDDMTIYVFNPYGDAVKPFQRLLTGAIGNLACKPDGVDVTVNGIRYLDMTCISVMENKDPLPYYHPSMGTLVTKRRQ